MAHSPPQPIDSDCPLSRSDQTRNILVFGTNVALIYLAAPVVYVGATQAALCKHLGASAKLSNLPLSVYLWTSPLPVFFAWYFSRVSQLKVVLVSAYLGLAAASAFVFAALVFEAPSQVVIFSLCLHAGILGCGLGVTNTFSWEMLGRGVSARRRGQALALAYGAGPVLAFISSLGSQLVLKGSVEVPAISAGWKFGLTRISISPLAYPWNFAFLFGAVVPMMSLAAVQSSRCVVPRPNREEPREDIMTGLLGGFREYLAHRTTLLAVIGYILVYSGVSIQTTASLYTVHATGRALTDYVGYQNALRFGAKAIAGSLIGWLVSRTNPRNALIATTLLTILAVAWALLVPGPWFLLCFGILGAGELMGAFFTSYILCCSAKSKMRRNMAFTSLIAMPAGFAPVIYGAIVDHGDLFRHAARQGIGGAEAIAPKGELLVSGFQLSFGLSIALLTFAMLLVCCLLPKHPQPGRSDDGN